MPFSRNFALPYENAMPNGDQPGITLHGGIPPTGVPPEEQILALRLDDVLETFTAEDVDFETRISTLEVAVAAARWRHIAEGTAIDPDATIDIVVPAGYSRLRLKMIGDLTPGTAGVLVRVNGDVSTIYVRGYYSRDAAGAEVNEYNGGTSSIKVAEWSTTESNSIEVDISPTDGTQNPNIIGYSSRVSAASAVGQQVQFGWGKYTADAVVSVVNVALSSGTFATARWWLEGYLA